MFKKSLTLLLVILMSISMTACGKKPSGNEGEGNEKYSGTVMLYTSTGEDVVVALKEAFEKKYPNVTMEYIQATSGKITSRLAAEFESGTIACDTLWLADFSGIMTYKKEDRLVQYKSPFAEKVDNKFKDPDGYYTAARIVVMGLGYSTTKSSAAEVPNNYDGLISETFRNQIIMTHPSNSGTTKALVYALVNSPKYGWKFFEDLKAYGTEVNESSNATNNAVASGGYKVCLGVDYNVKNLMDQGSPIGWRDTEDIVAVPCPIAVVKGCPQEELGKLLLDFILDPEGGQKVMVNMNITVSSPDVQLKPGMLSSTELASKALPIDWEDLAANGKDMIAKYNEIFQK
ncbi:MAG: ABC transporter substrate-binding protein [Erysipelotrichaceae bacterium]|nr:ABC transporter substrate-binding protein [Erysipelotrichaceae bacterium]